MFKQINKILITFSLMGIISFFSFKSKKNEIEREKPTTSKVPQFDSITYEEQIKIFETLGYVFSDGVSKDLILTDGYAKPIPDEFKKEQLQEIEQKPFSRLYFFYGWRNPVIPNSNFSDKCIWFDIEFIDSPEQYVWFMERMGVITNGDITYSDISIQVDKNNYEWIIFNVNGINKKWKLEKVGYISDSFFKRFSYLPAELNTLGKYTYYDDGSQQFVIDYATEKEQTEFIKTTGLEREWLDEGNHFNEPK